MPLASEAVPPALAAARGVSSVAPLETLWSYFTKAMGMAKKRNLNRTLGSAPAMSGSGFHAQTGRRRWLAAFFLNCIQNAFNSSTSVSLRAAWFWLGQVRTSESLRRRPANKVQKFFLAKSKSGASNEPARKGNPWMTALKSQISNRKSLFPARSLRPQPSATGAGPNRQSPIATPPSVRSVSSYSTTTLPGGAKRNSQPANLLPLSRT